VTVVVYRDGVMASDSAVHMDGIYSGSTTKIARSPNGMLGGGCGDGGAVGRFIDWIKSGASGNFESKAGDRSFGALLVNPDGTVLALCNDGSAFPLLAPFYADGSGSTIAMGAMEMGATAEQAVEAAIKWDSGCRGPIQVERIENSLRPSDGQ
jgi:hypothetical protein